MAVIASPFLYKMAVGGTLDEMGDHVFDAQEALSVSGNRLFCTRDDGQRDGGSDAVNGTLISFDVGSSR